MEGQIIHSQVVGSAALGILQASLQGHVIGTPSGGVFLRTEAGWVLFLSFAAWRGPLTINLPSAGITNLHLDLHTPFRIGTGSITFPQEQFAVEFSQAERWSPPPRPQQVLPLAERVQRFAVVAAAVNGNFANRAQSRPDIPTPMVGQSSKVEFLGLPAQQKFLVPAKPDKIVSALVAGLGLGPGLTPAGDDMSLGFLLALNRWGDWLRPDLPPEPINQALMDAARQRTTALSASLIECAASGQADERLVAALDGLVSGTIAEDRIVEYLLGWGYSSGVAAMQGMRLALGGENVQTC